MRYTQFGNTGLVVSKIGFGGIPIARLERQEAIQIVRRAFELGVTFFDSAKAYLDSEAKIGEALLGNRQAVLLASKSLSRTKSEMSADLEQCLKNYQTDYIDLYQLHNIADEATWQRVSAPDGALTALKEARQAGKVRFIGVTTHSRDLAPKLIQSGEFVSVMVAFSYLEPEPRERILPLCREHNVASLIMKPFSGGALDTPVTCLKWVLQQGVTMALPGIASLAELEQDVAVADMDWTLTTDELATMERTKAEVGKVFCRNCNYCQPCPQNIPISNVLHIDSLLHRYGPIWFSDTMFEKAATAVAGCVECHACETRCPYKLPIPELLRESVETLRVALGK